MLPCAALVPASLSRTVSSIISRPGSEGAAGSLIRTRFFFLGDGVVKAVEDKFVQAESYLDSALSVNSDWARPSGTGVLFSLLMLVTGRLFPAYGFGISLAAQSCYALCIPFLLLIFDLLHYVIKI